MTEDRDKYVYYEEERIGWNKKRVTRIGRDGNYSETIEPIVKGSPETNSDHWYKKPVGIILLSVMAGLILFVITLTARHFLGISN